MKILFAGDYCPSGRVSNFFEASNFSNVLEEVRILNEQVDYSVVNFETNVAVETDQAIKKSGPCLKCDERGVDAIKWAGFDLLCLANNHFRDFGDSAVKRTISSANNHNLDVVGGGDNIESASKIFYKTIKGKIVAFINVCENEFSIATEKRGGSNPLNPIKQYYDIREARKKADKVFVIVHGGHEHCQEPSIRMKQVYRFFIDAGADVVINHHQHCYCSYEVYKGKPIFYGLGNFCFDKLNDKLPESWCYGYVVIISIDEVVTYEIIPYEQCTKERPSIHFLDVKDEFYKQLDNLNNILADDNKLKDYLYTFYDKNPVIGITIPVLYRHWNRLRKYVQKHLNPEWYFHLRDYILCESHNDRISYELEKTINNK